jgi:hypothetical protein
MIYQMPPAAAKELHKIYELDNTYCVGITEWYRFIKDYTGCDKVTSNSYVKLELHFSDEKKFTWFSLKQ